MDDKIYTLFEAKNISWDTLDTILQPGRSTHTLILAFRADLNFTRRSAGKAILASLPSSPLRIRDGKPLGLATEEMADVLGPFYREDVILVSIDGLTLDEIGPVADEAAKVTGFLYSLSMAEDPRLARIVRALTPIALVSKPMVVTGMPDASMEDENLTGYDLPSGWGVGTVPEWAFQTIMAAGVAAA